MGDEAFPVAASPAFSINSLWRHPGRPPHPTLSPSRHLALSPSIRTPRRFRGPQEAFRLKADREILQWLYPEQAFQPGAAGQATPVKERAEPRFFQQKFTVENWSVSQVVQGDGLSGRPNRKRCFLLACLVVPLSPHAVRRRLEVAEPEFSLSSQLLRAFIEIVRH